MSVTVPKLSLPQKRHDHDSSNWCTTRFGIVLATLFAARTPRVNRAAGNVSPQNVQQIVSRNHRGDEVMTPWHAREKCAINMLGSGAHFSCKNDSSRLKKLRFFTMSN